MANPTLLQDKFDGGFKRDPPSDQLPKNALYDVQNFLPPGAVSSLNSPHSAPLRKRGGWSYEGNALDTLDAAATVPKRVFFAGFTTSTDPLGSLTAQVLAWDNNGKMFDVSNNVDRGDTTVPLHTPIIFRDLVIWGDGAAAPKKYVQAGTISNLGGSPPTNGRICTVWNERVLFSGSMASPAAAASIYFSAAGNAESWDTTNAVVRTNDTIQGFATLPNALLVFHTGSVEKILGNTPPSATNIGDLARQSLYSNVGLFEPNALAVQNEAAYWADKNGVYKTDGAALTDLTALGGIKTYWQEQLAAGVDRIAVGVWKGYVFVSLTASDAEIKFLVCDIEKKSWWTFTNITALNFSPRYGATDDLYFSNRQTKRVGKLSTCFSPTASVKNDADGEAVIPILITGYFRPQGQGLKRLRHIYLGYDLRDAATDNPTLAIDVARSPNGSFDNTTTPTLAETTAFARKRVRVQGATAKPNTMSGFMVSVSQGSLPSSETKIYAIEADFTQREGSRRG